ncbi:MAG: serine protease [Chitinophagales bacterium]
MLLFGNEYHKSSGYYLISIFNYFQQTISDFTDFLYKVIYSFPKLTKQNSVTDKTIQHQALCAGIFIKKDQLQLINDTTYSLQTQHLGKDKNLHVSDIFYNERYIKKAAGSCFVKSKNTVSTAYHVVDSVGDIDIFIDNYVVVFGLTDTGDATIFLPKENAIELEKVIASDSSENYDFIDFKLKDTIPSFVKVPAQNETDLKVGDTIYIAGYPLKTALTISDKAVINTLHDTYFTTHADVFEYSSGSPVFLARNNALIGFVKGNKEQDLICNENLNCMQTNIIEPNASNEKKIILLTN